MLEINGMRIIPVRGGGVSGHVVRSRSGVKLAAFHGARSLERAISHASERSSRTGGVSRG